MANPARGELRRRVRVLLCVCACLTRAASSDYDVLVYGSTPAGVLAALGAAGEGARVALLDPRGWVGGCMSGGLSVTDVGVTTAVIGGRTRAFFEAVARHYGSNASAQWNFEPHVAESIFSSLLAAAAVDVRLNSRISGLSTSPGAGGGRKNSGGVPVSAAAPDLSFLF